VTAAPPFRVALTFDAEHPDRPHRPGVTDAILDTLADADVRSTWFLQGRWVEAQPATAARVAREGHLVGNHTFYHARLPLLTDEGIATDIRAAEEVIREVVGVDPRPWFR
jgi:peptidoglycan/xylan/chitin deacetylase (PgdA/CDA1 family)